MVDTVEYKFRAVSVARRAVNVVECALRCGWSPVVRRSAVSLAATVVLVAMLCTASAPAAAVVAGEVRTSTPVAAQESVINVTNDITDPQNLLGSDIAALVDQVQQTRKQTGVSVKLLYVPRFGSGEDPQRWAGGILESSDAKPNTVLLAVASEDGNLVVAVSANSDEWLRRQSTVDALSQAAQKPLATGSGPDWSGSAASMMTEVVQQHHSTTLLPGSWWGVAAMGLVIVASVSAVSRKRGRNRLRHSDTKLSARVQRTFRHRRHSGKHE